MTTIPQSLSNIVTKCLERDLELRYTTANELLADLETWQGKRAGATLRFEPKIGPWGRTIPWPSITAIVAVLALAVSGYVWRDKLLRPSAGRTAPLRRCRWQSCPLGMLPEILASTGLARVWRRC